MARTSCFHTSEGSEKIDHVAETPKLAEMDYLLRPSLVKRRGRGGTDSTRSAPDHRSAMEWIAKRPRRHFARVVWMALLIVGFLLVGNIFFPSNAFDVYYWPPRARLEGLVSEGPFYSWNLYSKLVQTRVHQNTTYEMASIPHVSSGALCGSCHIDLQTCPMRRPPWVIWEYALEGLKSILRIQGSHTKDGEGTKTCYGCLHKLERAEENGSFDLVEGPSAAGGVLYASGPNVPNGKAVVKIHCLNEKAFLRGEACAGEFIRAADHERAVRKIALECGLEDVLVKAWLGPVDGMNGAEHLRTMGIWSDVAEGLSITSVWTQATSKEAVQLIKGINSTQVIMAALLDALTNQYNRGPRNAFVSKSGRLTLIDNERILMSPGRLKRSRGFFFRQTGCNSMPNSLFFPGPGHGRGETLLMGERKKNTVVGMDYRCHALNGTLGATFPPKMEMCLSKFSDMTASELQQEIFAGGMDVELARVLIGRSKDLLNLGFEGAIEKWYAADDEGGNLEEWGEPCCRIELVDGAVANECG